MPLTPNIAIAVLAGAAVLALIVYIAMRYYEARFDRTYMTFDENGFKRALKGKTILWNWEERVVKGPSAPQVAFVAVDPASGGRRLVRLLDERTGAVNLRPQYCSPLPFAAITTDGHKVIVEARVQFSLNRALMRHVYEIQEFSLALETRIHSAFRAAIGKYRDEDLRASLQDVERNVIEQLRQAERDGDEAGEQGMALGINFHTANFTYEEPDEFAPQSAPIIAGAKGASADVQTALRGAAGARGQGVLALRPQQLDQLADVFKNRDPASTAAMLALLDMQTRQNIAEALASSGQLLVLTPQELGLVSAAAQRDAIARRDPHAPAVASGAAANGAARGELRP